MFGIGGLGENVSNSLIRMTPICLYMLSLVGKYVWKGLGDVDLSVEVFYWEVRFQKTCAITS